MTEHQLLPSQLFTNLIQNHYEITPNYTLAAEYLVYWVPKLNEDYELQKRITTKGETGVFTPTSPGWLRLVEEVRTWWVIHLHFQEGIVHEAQLKHLFELVNSKEKVAA